jgi:hypothetical protein
MFLLLNSLSALARTARRRIYALSGNFSAPGGVLLKRSVSATFSIHVFMPVNIRVYSDYV